MRVKLHSMDPSAVKATDECLRQVAQLSELVRTIFVHTLDDDHKEVLAVDDEGFVEIVPMEDHRADFLKFACERQGYVAEVRTD